MRNQGNTKRVISCLAFDISEYSKEREDKIYISFPLRSLLDLLPVEGAFITEIPINRNLGENVLRSVTSDLFFLCDHFE